MKKLSDKNKCLITLILVLGTILACQIIPPDSEREVFANSGEYAFDINTIHESLLQGTPNTFISLQENMILPTPQTANQDKLNFADLLDIAQVFHEFRWKEPMSTWSVNNLAYQLDCENDKYLPSFMEISLFTLGHSQDKNSRFVHTIQIGHPEGTIYWSETERYPITENWQSIDIAQINISPEVALEIAEENGGREARLAIKNNCTIYVMLASYLSTKEWVVRYASYSPDTGWRYLLEVYVDKISGEFRIVHPK